MTRSRSLMVGLVVALGIGAYVVYDQVLRGDAAPALALPSAAPRATSGAPAATFALDVNGTWTVTTGSQAGYRVRERLANLPAESDAVGRTSHVKGSVTVTSDGTTTTVTDGTMTVDTLFLVSDKGSRDGHVRNEVLDTDQYPTATFTLTRPADVPAAALDGAASDIILVGDLTLHGVTKAVEIPAQAQLVNRQIQVAGSISFPLSDFAIVAPNLGGPVLSIADEGTLEFSMVFEKS